MFLLVFVNHGNSLEIFWCFDAHFSKFINPINFSFLKLGLDDDTAFNLPDSLTYEDIGEHVGNGSDKDAYKLKAYPNLLFLMLYNTSSF
jgi:hypothetical protein